MNRSTGRFASLRAEKALSPMVALAVVFAIAYLAYRPGLSGGFLFDDFTNLAALGYQGAVDNLQKFWLYLLSGFAGPTGRPVALASFLIDAHTWPADPWPFKHTNVLIHLANGALLFGLTRQLARALGQSATAGGWVAVLATALWLLHPFWVSTTLYAVQRMTQLATLFVLAGLWLYVEIRLRRAPTAAPWTVASLLLTVWLFTLLAVLSKENGALLPLLALVLEGTILAAHTRRQDLIATKAFRLWRAMILGIPILLLMYLLLPQTGALMAGEPGTRDYTPGERLLTQGRILWDYIGHLALPRPWTGGLFQDHIAISTGLLSPWTTALAWGAWLAVLGFSLAWRMRYPAFAAAVLFFLAGHVLESSFINLELYFEHRNYLPSVLLGLPLALFWLRWNRPDSIARILVPALILVLLTTLTFIRTDLWGNPFQQALKWSQLQNESARAQHHLSDFWRDTGHFEEAERLNNHAIQLAPEGLAWHIKAVFLACERQSSAEEEILAAVRAVNRWELLGTVQQHQVSTLLSYLHRNDCPYLDDQGMLAIIAALEAADERRARPALQHTLNQWRGRILLAQGDARGAITYFQESIGESSRPGQLLAITGLLASHSHLEEALEFLDSIQFGTAQERDRISARLFDWYTQRTGYFERERKSLRATIEQELRALDKRTEKALPK